jgi:hypothetical protein
MITAVYMGGDELTIPQHHNLAAQVVFVLVVDVGRNESAQSREMTCLRNSSRSHYAL